MIQISEALMDKMWPGGDAKIPGLRMGIADSSERVFRKYGITTPLQAMHILAQISHECGAGSEVVENLNYRAGQLTTQWPSHFTTAQALAMQHQPQKIANQAYNGRMKNRLGSNDGWEYRGRGAAQTTGREGYENLAQKTGLDLLNNPDLVNDPAHFLECGVADFIICGCLPYCTPKPGLPDGDISGVTHHLNGGYIGLAQRQQWFAKWKGVLRVAAPAIAVAPRAQLLDDPAVDVAQDPVEAQDTVADEPAPVDDGVLRFGRGHDAPDFEVKALQAQLVSLGYQVGTQDGDFGSGTRAAVLAFQADNDLPTTGEVDAATKTQLKTAPPKPISEKRANTTVDDLRAEGSGTVKAADHLTWWGRGLAFFGIGSGAAQQTGVLDKAQSAVDQASTLRTIIDSVQDIAGWALQYWWLFAIPLGILAWKFGGDIIKRRLEDHRSAANMRL